MAFVVGDRVTLKDHPSFRAQVTRVHPVKGKSPQQYSVREASDGPDLMWSEKMLFLCPAATKKPATKKTR